MKRKMHDLAFGAKCDGFTVKGVADSITSLAELCLVKKPSLSNSAVRANPANPAPASQKNSRRVPVQRPHFCWDDFDIGSSQSRYANSFKLRINLQTAASALCPAES